MKFINKNINVLTMKYPSSWYGGLWREGLVSGNGKIGANIYGGTRKETVIINHAELWSGKFEQTLPDVSDCLAKTRGAMDEGRFQEANLILANALKENGYGNERGYPLPLAELNMVFSGLPGFSNYLRAVNMETCEVSSQFRENNVWVKKDLFVSRKDDIIILNIAADMPILNVEISLDTCKGKSHSDSVYEYVKRNRNLGVNDKILTYESMDTSKLTYGAVARVDSNDGIVRMTGNVIKVTGASQILVKIKVFVKGRSSIEVLMEQIKNENENYEYYLERHIPVHQALYNSVELSLGENCNLSNEELLLEAYSGTSPNELIEKLWRYGRYLFIIGSCADGLPFTMYGLWAGEYHQMWSHNMANENIQMMYWHTNVGNLHEMNKALFKYYNSRIEYFSESAKKLYGCNGIFVPAGTTPNMALPNQIVPVILNWTGAAGWIAQHYYRHYLYTRDTVYLHSTLLPFMKEAADFYEDFIVFDEEGNVKIYPSVSPENTPLNFIPLSDQNVAHPMPTTINSTMDLAIVKELFTNLVKISIENDLYSDKIYAWKNIINSIPEYKINGDGAIREWQSELFEDRYYHRHISHIYPIFPGEEITTHNNIISAFEKAIDLRESGAQTGWSLAHTASIYARFERGNDAMRCLNNIVKTCMQKNLFTVHNDWRCMDGTLEMESDVPIQLDAIIGYVNAVQEMILYSSEKLIKLLPALPDNMDCGEINGWKFPGGSVNMKWDIPNNSFKAILQTDRAMNVDIELPVFFADDIICQGSSISVKHGRMLSVEFKCEDILILSVNLYK